MLNLTAFSVWGATALRVFAQFILVNHNTVRNNEVVTSTVRARAALATVGLLDALFLTIG